jgi:hypothetical protein
VKSTTLVGLALGLLSIFAADARAAANAPERSVSPSGQFVIYGGDAGLRGAISTLAERIKVDLLGVLQQRDNWKIAAVINLQPRAANLPEVPATAFRFSQTPSGLKLQLDLTIARELNPEVLEREILRLILLEMIYRKQSGIASGETYVAPPPWLVEGLLALAPNGNRASLARALSVAENVRSLDEFLQERPELLDSTARSLYRAYSFALVQLLARDPAQLGRYIDNIAFSANDPLGDLRKSFSRLAGNDFEKIWRAKIDNVIDSRRSELLSFGESEANLDALLRAFSLEELCQKKLNATQKGELKKFSEDLMLLAARANPALRPIVQNYEQLAAQLALGKNHGVAAKLSDLKKVRTELVARMTEIDDYMNWFEATQLKTPSGLFEAVKVSIDAAETRPRRHDGFSTYLDAMESQF